MLSMSKDPVRDDRLVSITLGPLACASSQGILRLSSGFEVSQGEVTITVRPNEPLLVRRHAISLASADQFDLLDLKIGFVSVFASSPEEDLQMSLYATRYDLGSFFEGRWEAGPHRALVEGRLGHPILSRVCQVWQDVSIEARLRDGSPACQFEAVLLGDLVSLRDDALGALDGNKCRCGNSGTSDIIEMAGTAALGLLCRGDEDLVDPWGATRSRGCLDRQ